MSAKGGDRSETLRGHVGVVVDLFRDLFESDPLIALTGGIVVAVVALAGVGYAVSVSLVGTAMAAIAWLVFAGSLVWKGWSATAFSRAVVGAGLYVLAIPTVVRLVTTTPPVASRRYDMARLPIFASVVILVLLAGFTAWAVRTT